MSLWPPISRRCGREGRGKSKALQRWSRRRAWSASWQQSKRLGGRSTCTLAVGSKSGRNLSSIDVFYQEGFHFRAFPDSLTVACSGSSPAQRQHCVSNLTRHPPIAFSLARRVHHLTIRKPLCFSCCLPSRRHVTSTALPHGLRSAPPLRPALLKPNTDPGTPPILAATILPALPSSDAAHYDFLRIILIAKSPPALTCFLSRPANPTTATRTTSLEGRNTYRPLQRRSQP